jgi:hypothetical protein
MANSPGFFQLPRDNSSGGSKKVNKILVNETSNITNDTVVNRSVELVV